MRQSRPLSSSKLPYLLPTNPWCRWTYLTPPIPTPEELFVHATNIITEILDIFGTFASRNGKVYSVQRLQSWIEVVLLIRVLVNMSGKLKLAECFSS